MIFASSTPIVRPFTHRSLFWCAAAYCLVALMIALSWRATPWAIRTFMAPGSIRIVNAVYGGPCGANDLTVITTERCEGRFACEITLSPATLGDSAKKCPPNFAVSWVCGKSVDFKLAIVSDPASKATIACPSESHGNVK